MYPSSSRGAPPPPTSVFSAVSSAAICRLATWRTRCQIGDSTDLVNPAIPGNQFPGPASSRWSYEFLQSVFADSITDGLVVRSIFGGPFPRIRFDIIPAPLDQPCVVRNARLFSFKLFPQWG